MTRFIVLFAAMVVLGALAVPCTAISLDPFSSSGSGSSGSGCVFGGGGGTGNTDPFPQGNGGAGSANDGCTWGTGGTGNVDPFGDSGGTSGNSCPFDDGSGTGNVDPFGDSGGTSGDNCPFDDGSGTGNVDPFGNGSGAGDADPFPIFDPTSLLVPCPFPQTGSSGGAGICQESYAPPIDVDEDGFYEDLNGNGRTDFADVIIYFKNMDFIRKNQPTVCFDFNENGNIDFADMILLFKEVG